MKPDIQLTSVTRKNAGFSSHPLHQNTHSQTIPGHNLIKHNPPHPPLALPLCPLEFSFRDKQRHPDPQPHVL